MMAYLAGVAPWVRTTDHSAGPSASSETSATEDFAAVLARTPLTGLPTQAQAQAQPQAPTQTQTQPQPQLQPQPQIPSQLQLQIQTIAEHLAAAATSDVATTSATPVVAALPSSGRGDVGQAADKLAGSVRGSAAESKVTPAAVSARLNPGITNTSAAKAIEVDEVVAPASDNDAAAQDLQPADSANQKPVAASADSTIAPIALATGDAPQTATATTGAVGAARGTDHTSPSHRETNRLAKNDETRNDGTRNDGVKNDGATGKPTHPAAGETAKVTSIIAVTAAPELVQSAAVVLADASGPVTRTGSPSAADAGATAVTAGSPGRGVSASPANKPSTDIQRASQLTPAGATQTPELKPAPRLDPKPDQKSATTTAPPSAGGSATAAVEGAGSLSRAAAAAGDAVGADRTGALATADAPRIAAAAATPVTGLASGQAPVHASGLTSAQAGQGIEALPASTALAQSSLRATPTSLEVGVASGAHGWLKVRAELTPDGGVRASLTGSTPAAASSLRGELPAMAAYLQGEKVPVSSLAVTAPAMVSSAPDAAGHLLAAAGQAAYVDALHAASPASLADHARGTDPAGTGGLDGNPDGRAADAQGQPDRRPEGGSTSPGIDEDRRTPDSSLAGAARAAEYAGGNGLDGSGSGLSLEYGSGGGWLNVRV